MTSEERDLYWIPACICLGITVTKVSFKWKGALVLDEALGVSEESNWRATPPSGETPLPPELKELLIKLAGPHGPVLLKAYRIKKGLDE